MIQFLKIREVKSPKRNFGDAGIDFFVPEYNQEFEKDLKEKNNKYLTITKEYIEIKPGDSVLIPTGIKSKFEPNLALEAANKSGICTKTSMIIGASVIDSNYQGEIHIHMINVGNTIQRITYGMKLAQFIPRYIDPTDIKIVENISSEDFYEYKTERGEGGFGSTSIHE